MSPVRGARFITLEGIDGAGKSTHLAGLGAMLRARGKDVVVTREPGGTALGEALRGLLLEQPMHVDTETLLMLAARREHLAQVIVPALAAGRWVLCDRFTDATYAYQGGGRGVAAERIAVLERWIDAGATPDLTLVFDVPADVARKRRASSASRPDRFEREDPAFFERVRQVYLDRARAEPRRIRIVDADRPPAKVKEELEDIISSICKS
jgi:dTMP kinase